ncbi:unnamed protein product [Litomosoides sigmodontis]|uniref:TLC domain-containing protein n=1 Tax=Litomosoides sigmodontis TaxID=42156 RepID=A0A3P6SLZ8_LITSI|nr:unnamed protein product [Litomosoides sigmodontis]
MDRYEGAEFRLPPLEGIFEPDFRIPFITYFLLFQVTVPTAEFNTVRNSFKHQWPVVICIFRNSPASDARRNDALVQSMGQTTPNSLHSQKLLFYYYRCCANGIAAYFICDTMDMLRHEISRWTVELLFHHAASVFAFASAVLSRKFIPYAYWALLMEINSIFLHLRSLMQITGYSLLKQSLFRVIQLTNIVTFVLFRFAVQMWQINWAWINRRHFHIFYSWIAFIGGGFFLTTNAILFVRILASDGYLGEFGRQHAAINRSSRNLVDSGTMYYTTHFNFCVSLNFRMLKYELNLSIHYSGKER